MKMLCHFHLNVCKPLFKYTPFKNNYTKVEIHCSDCGIVIVLILSNMS